MCKQIDKNTNIKYDNTNEIQLSPTPWNTVILKTNIIHEKKQDKQKYRELMAEMICFDEQIIYLIFEN